MGEGGRRRSRKAQCRGVAAARRPQYPPPLSGGGDPDSRHDGTRLRRVVRVVPAHVRFSERTAQLRVREPAAQGELGPQAAPPDDLFRRRHAAARHPYHGRGRPDEPEQDAAQYTGGRIPHGLPQAQGQRRAARRREIRRTAARASRFAPAGLSADAYRRRIGGGAQGVQAEGFGRRRAAVHHPDPFPVAAGGDARSAGGDPQDTRGRVARHQPAGLYRRGVAPRAYDPAAAGAQCAGRGLLLHLLGEGVSGELRRLYAQQPVAAGTARGEDLRPADARTGRGAGCRAGEGRRHGRTAPPLYEETPAAVPCDRPQRAEPAGHRQEHVVQAGGHYARRQAHPALRP